MKLREKILKKLKYLRKYPEGTMYVLDNLEALFQKEMKRVIDSVEAGYKGVIDKDLTETIKRNLRKEDNL